MADIKKTIEILFAGTDNLSGTIGGMSNNIISFGNTISDIGQPFADAVQKVALLDAAIVGLGVAAISARAEIESETAKMQAALGLLPEEAEKFKEVAERIYIAGFGESMTETFDIVTLAAQKFRGETTEGIEDISLKAIQLEEVFKVDFNESLSAAQTLMKNFGLTSDEAFKFIVSGFQQGLNGSGDFLDSITEYSPQFQNGGADAGQFFSILQTGFAGGILGTDKAADAFKEFRVRIQDGSKLTKESLEAIGIDPVKFQDNLNSGKISAIEAFQIIIDKLGATKDSATVMQAGVGLIGTQFEDLGTKAALNLDIAKTKVSDLKGEIDKVDIDGVERKWSSAWRTIRKEIISPKEWDEVEKIVTETVVSIAKSIGPALEKVDLSVLVDAFKEVWDAIGDIFIGADIDLTTVEGMQEAVQLVVNGLVGLGKVTEGIVESFGPIVKILIGLFEDFGNLDKDTQELIGNIAGFGSQLVILGGIVSVGGVLLKGLTGLTGKIGLLYIAFEAGYKIVEYAAKFLGLTENTDKAKESVDGLNRSLDELRKDPDVLVFDIDLENIERVDQTIKALPGEKKLDIVVEAAGKEAEEVKRLLAGESDWFNDEEVQKVLNVVGTEDIEKVKKDIDEIKEAKVKVELDKKSAEELAKELDPLKTFEIQTQLNIAQIDRDIEAIKASAETAQAAFEWSAKVDIAEAEASAKKVIAAFDSINVGIKSTSDLISKSLDALGGYETFEEKWAARDILKQETEQRDALFRLQEKQIEAEIKLTKARAEAIERGEGVIKIDSTGLEPALELVMWEIIEKVQIRANEEASEFLLGLST